ncbi:MmcQ/YjbR family DNA-binding protein [Piscicoccus intestinalis]|uniref:MmcQ/YjbR family DNA-binding protein n=1 Tax=Piscicoccus intestinalis TaxID=746033 RepID=UPI001FE2214A|nr:MmcQ/YjbR family DNA-binding protein [Piscicoccus intestinalis]
MDHQTFPLQDRARETARALPGVTEGYPFTDTLQVFKVAGRVFLIVTEDPDQPFITSRRSPRTSRHWLPSTPACNRAAT